MTFENNNGFIDLNVGTGIELTEVFDLFIKANTGGEDLTDNSWNVGADDVDVVIEYTLDKTVSINGTDFDESVVAEPGDIITYKIVVTNSENSNVSLTGVKLEDELPAGVFDLSTVQFSTDGNTWTDCDDNTTIILNNNLTVAKGTSATYYIKATVLSGLKVTEDSRYTNTASTSGSTIVGDSDTADVVVEAPKVCNLTITKTVAGNMGDYNKAFDFTATLSGEGYSFNGVTYTIDEGETQDAGTGTTCTFTLKHDQSITFVGLPIGASFTVTEAENTYVTEVDGTKAATKTITLAENNDDIVFVNTKNVTIDTGISLETLPYILILGVVAVGAVLLLRKRRFGDE